jgi:hypothetical protein
MCCFPAFIICVEFSVMNVVYREISAFILNPFKTYVQSVEIIVMNVE